ncbi:MAG TPA: hypothetical protein VK843_04970 [Planctomycetota bacterium]|nr:hypothetical protein [Planctomycetota bacterium]
MKASSVSRLDKLSLLAMVGGVALVLQPWWRGGFQIGFAVTGAGVVLQIVAAHLPRKEGA